MTTSKMIIRHHLRILRACTRILILLSLAIAITGVIPLQALAAEAAVSHTVAKPQMAKDGQIICGAKSIRQKYMMPPYNALTVMLQGEDICSGSERMDLGMGDVSPLFFIFSSRKEIFLGNSTIYTADVRAGTASSEKLGTYKLSLTYLENGLAKVESRLVLDDPSKLKSRAYTFSIPKHLTLQGVYIRDGKAVSFNKTINRSFGTNELQGLKIIYFPDNQDARFSIQPDQCSNILCNNNGMTFYPDTNGVISFLIDISGGKSGDNSETAPNGINTWNVDKLHLPDYNASLNLVQNPSFEAGLRYWAYRIFADDAMPIKYKDIYELDTAVAHSGQNSLRIRALSINNTLPLGNYPLPYMPGEKYTLSFYAKGSLNKGVTLTAQGRSGQKGQQTFTASPNFELGNEWKRYHLSFVAVDNFVTFYFTAKLNNISCEAEEYAWLDDVQIEKGELTDFQQAPHAMQLTSYKRRSKSAADGGVIVRHRGYTYPFPDGESITFPSSL